MDPAEMVEMLIEKAEALRKAGVTRLKLGDTEVVFDPYVPEPKTEQVDPELDRMIASESYDPLKSSSTFIGGRVPGYRKPREF